MASVGTAFIKVRPDLSGFHKTVTSKVRGISPLSGLKKQAAKDGTEAGNQFARNFSAPIRSVGKSAGRMGASIRKGLAGGIAAARDLGTSFREANAVANSVARGVSRVGSMAKRGMAPAVTAAQNLVAGFRDSRAAASAFTGRMGTVGGALRKAINPAVAGVAALGKGFTRAGGTAVSVFRRAGASIRSGMASAATSVGGVGSALRQMGVIGSAAIAAIGIGSFVRDVATAASNLQKTTLAMSGLYGSSVKAAATMKLLRDYARGTPIPTQEIYDAGKNLAYLGLKGNDALGVIKNIGIALSASGNTSQGAMTAVTQAILRMQSAGKLYAQDIQNVSDQMVPAWDLLAAHQHKSIAEVREDVTAGKLTYKDFIAALKAGDGDYFKMMRKSAGSASKSFSAQFAIIKDNVVQTMGETVLPLLDKLTPVMSRLGTSISTGLKNLPGLLARIGATLKNAGVVDGFRRLWEGIKSIASALAPMAKAFGTIFGGAILAVLKAAGPLGSILSAIGGWMSRNTGVVKVLGAALAGLAIACGVMRSAIIAWTVVQWVLNAALLSNPIGLIIAAIGALVAVIVYIATKTTWFQTIWGAVWGFIKTIALWVWNSVLKPVFNALTAAWHAVATAALWFWRNVLSPVAKGIATAFKVLALVVAGIVGFFVVQFKLWARIAIWLWRVAISPVLNWIASGFKWLYNKAIKPVINWIVAAWRWLYKVNAAVTNWIVGKIRWLGSVAKWLYNKAIKPAINWIVAAWRWLWSINRAVTGWIVGKIHWLGSVVKWLYNKAIKPALNWIGSKFRWLYNNIVKPVMNWIGSKIKSAYNKVIAPVFRALHKAVNWVADSFWTAIHSIQKAWSWLKKIVAKPVHFVIDTVYNQGIQPFVQKVAKWVGIGYPKKLKIGFAEGGILPGYSPNRDNMVANTPVGPVGLAGGEGIVKASRVREYGPGLIHALNNGTFPHFSGGGVFGSIGGAISSAWSGVKSAGSWAWGKVKGGADWLYEHSVGALWKKLGGWIRSMIGSIAGGKGGNFGEALRRIPKKLMEAIIKKLQESVMSGGSGDGAKALAWAKKQLGKPYVWGATGPGSFDCSELTMRAWQHAGHNIGRTTYDQVKKGKRVSRAKSGPGDLAFPHPGHVMMVANSGAKGPRGMIEAPHTGANVRMSSFRGGIIKQIAPRGGGPVGKKNGSYRDMVTRILRELGMSVPYNLNNVLRAIQKESGGNPNAINRWDSNARAGHPSQGLLQTIPSTFNAYAGKYRHLGIRNPYANVYAAIRYAKARYGAGWSSRMARPGGYWKGGLAKGWSLVGERGPELMNVGSTSRVISNKELNGMVGRQAGSGPAIGTLVAQLPKDATVQDLVREVNYEWRKHERGGKYA